MDLSADYQLLSSTRYDSCLLNLPWNTLANGGIPSPYLLLKYNLDRLLDAAQKHAWTNAQCWTLIDLKNACDEAVRDALFKLQTSDAPLKIRILLSSDGHLTATASPTGTLSAIDPCACSLLPFTSEYPIALQSSVRLGTPLLTIHLDTYPTQPSLFTRTKTNHRQDYDAARARLGIPPLPAPSNADVLLYAPSGEPTETSIRNIAFMRGSPPRWITPRTETGCLTGIMRRWLLEQGRVVEANEGELLKHDLVEGEYVLTFNGVEGCRLGRIVLASGQRQN